MLCFLIVNLRNKPSSFMPSTAPDTLHARKGLNEQVLSRISLRNMYVVELMDLVTLKLADANAGTAKAGTDAG